MSDDGEFGKMVSLKGNRFVVIELSEIVDQIKPVEPELYNIAEVFFG